MSLSVVYLFCIYLSVVRVHVDEASVLVFPVTHLCRFFPFYPLRLSRSFFFSVLFFSHASLFRSLSLVGLLPSLFLSFVCRFFATFETEVMYQQKTLSNISEVSQILREVQRSWTFLQNLFIYSEEVKKELPQQATRFVEIDKSVKEILKIGEANPIIKVFCSQEGILQRLEAAEKELNICEKALNEFMDSKRMTFPRFYFVSSVDLLDILSNGNSPGKVMQHMSKVFQAIQTFQLDSDTDQKEENQLQQLGARPHAVGMESCVGKETVKFPVSLHLTGKVKKNKRRAQAGRSSQEERKRSCSSFFLSVKIKERKTPLSISSSSIMRRRRWDVSIYRRRKDGRSIS